MVPPAFQHQPASSPNLWDLSKLIIPFEGKKVSLCPKDRCVLGCLFATPLEGSRSSSHFQLPETRDWLWGRQHQLEWVWSSPCDYHLQVSLLREALLQCFPIISLLNAERLKELNVSDPPCPKMHHLWSLLFPGWVMCPRHGIRTIC